MTGPAVDDDDDAEGLIYAVPTKRQAGGIAVSVRELNAFRDALALAAEQETDRHRMIASLEAVSKLLSDLGAPAAYSRPFFDLAMALFAAEHGERPPIFEAAYQSSKSTPPIWIARADVAALVAVLKDLGMPRKEAEAFVAGELQAVIGRAIEKGEPKNAAATIGSWVSKLESGACKFDEIVSRYQRSRGTDRTFLPLLIPIDHLHGAPLTRGRLDGDLRPAWLAARLARLRSMLARLPDR